MNDMARLVGRRTRALAASLAALALGVAPMAPARAADDQTWACQVMLCVSNPGGWMEFQECVPPIEKLLSHLALGGSFPVCTGGGMAGASYKQKNGVTTITVTMSDGSKSTYVN